MKATDSRDPTLHRELFIRLRGSVNQDGTATACDLYYRMLALYPNGINPGSLWGSALA